MNFGLFVVRMLYICFILIFIYLFFKIYFTYLFIYCVFCVLYSWSVSFFYTVKSASKACRPQVRPQAVDLLTMSSTVSPSDNDPSDESSVSSTLACSSVTPPAVAAGVTPSTPTNAHPCNVSLPPTYYHGHPIVCVGGD